MRVTRARYVWSWPPHSYLLFDIVRGSPVTSLLATLSVSILCMAPVLAQAQSFLVGPDSQLLSPRELELGDCLSDAKAVDLREVLFISNQSLREKHGVGFNLLTIEEEKLVIEVHSSNRRQYDHAIPYDIRYFVDNGKSNVDLDLSFVELEDGQKALFWRETYKHRSHRQGILKWDGENLIKVCEGRGGVDSDD